MTGPGGGDGGRRLRLGISPCPNDTFAFAAILEGKVREPRFEITLADIEVLNEGLMRGEFDIAKASFHAAFLLEDSYEILPVGAAMGFGVGPLLLARDPDLAGRDPGPGDRVLCPGRWTTATLLYRLFVPEGPPPAFRIFSEIMPALSSGEAEYGVVIHEGRFTFEDRGLRLAVDLGARWEAETRCPLPLGGLLGRRSLGSARLERVTGAIRESLRIAREDPRSALPVMLRHAQELTPEVCRKHVDLYVNERTLDLGPEGRRALETLRAKVREAGLVPED